MKRVLCLTFGFLMAVIGIVAVKTQFAEAANARESNDPLCYPAVGVVVGFSEEDDIVFVRTHDGNEWSFEEIDDWQVGDKCCMVFSDNGTPGYVYDDQIVAVRYFA